MKLYRFLTVFALLAGTSLAACDSPTETDDDEKDVAGLELVGPSGTILASVNSARAVTGGLSVKVGAEATFELFFLDPQGERFQITAGDDEHSVKAVVGNTSIATVADHDGHFDLGGVGAGATTVSFIVVHGTHNDYESPAIPITVTP